MTTNTTELAKAYVSHNATTNGDVHFLAAGGVGLGASISKWVSELEAECAARFVETGDLSAFSQASALRNLDLADLEWRVKHLLAPDDPALYADPSRVPMDIWSKERTTRFGLKPQDDQGIFTSGVTRR
jgi:hypothetical protein